MSLLERLKSFLPQGAFARAVAVVAGGTVLGQVITMGASPLLMRVYSPADFGALAIYVSWSAGFAMVATLTYHQAIPLAKNASTGAALFLASILLIALTASLLAAALLLAPVFGLAPLSDLPFSPWLVIAGVVGLAFFETLSQWAVRASHFTALARSSVARSVAQVGTQLALGLSGFGALGLPIGQLVGQWTGAGALSVSALDRDKKGFRAVSRIRFLAALKRYRRFPTLTLPAVVLNALSVYAPALILAHFYDEATAGLYLAQERITAIPVSLVGQSAQRVFTSSAAQAHRDGTLGQLTSDAYGQLLRVSLPFIAILAACAPDAFAVIFGEQWREAGRLAQWVCLASALAVAVFPLTPVIYVLDKQWAGTVFQIALLASRAGIVAVAAWRGFEAITAVATGAVAIALSWVVYLIFLVRSAGSRLQPMARATLRELALSAALASPLLLARRLEASPLLITVSAAALGCLGLIILWRRRRVG